MEHFNDLSPAEAERLAMLAEEAGEIVHVIGKILRHGFDRRNPLEDGQSNRGLLQSEIGDFQAVVARMVKADDLDADDIGAAQSIKHQKLPRWTHHQPDSAVAPTLYSDVAGV